MLRTRRPGGVRGAARHEPGGGVRARPPALPGQEPAWRGRPAQLRGHPRVGGALRGRRAPRGPAARDGPAGARARPHAAPAARRRLAAGPHPGTAAAVPLRSPDDGQRPEAAGSAGCAGSERPEAAGSAGGEPNERRTRDGQPARHRRLGLQRRVREALDRRQPPPGRPPAVLARRDRGAGRPAAARLGAARARQPAAGQPRGVRRHRRGTAVGDDPRHRAQRLPGLAAGHPAGPGVRAADRRVPRRGRVDPRATARAA